MPAITTVQGNHKGVYQQGGMTTERIPTETMGTQTQINKSKNDITGVFQDVE